MARAIFISYRRDDSEGEAGRLYDDLVRVFGDDSVFMDVAGIDPGADFRAAIDKNVSSCGVLLALLGPRWATIAGASGRPRLEDADDFVRLEIASALKRNSAVIPVLVHEAKMPHPDQLPENLKELAYRNSVELTHARWNSDVQLLIAALKQYVQSTRATDSEPVHATVAVQLPAPNGDAASAMASPGPGAKLPRGAVVGGAIAVLLVVAALLLRGHGGAHEEGLLGSWRNPVPKMRNGLVQLEIEKGTGAGQVVMHAWGNCRPVNCDWGTRTARDTGRAASATWEVPAQEPGDAARTATVTATGGGAGLAVEVESRFPGGQSQSYHFAFVRAGGG